MWGKIAFYRIKVCLGCGAGRSFTFFRLFFVVIRKYLKFAGH